MHDLIADGGGVADFKDSIENQDVVHQLERAEPVVETIVVELD